MKSGGKWHKRAVPHSPNRKMHWAVKAAWKKLWEEEVWTAAQISDTAELWGDLTKPTVQVLLGTREAMDEDNAQASLKPIYDGMVKAGLLINDDPEHVKILPPLTSVVSKPSEEYCKIVVTS